MQHRSAVADWNYLARLWQQQQQPQTQQQQQQQQKEQCLKQQQGTGLRCLNCDLLYLWLAAAIAPAQIEFTTKAFFG